MKAEILLVEDEPLIRETTQEDLLDLGFSVTGASDCDEGWETLQAAENIAVLITDIRTPGELDGWELARRARKLRPALSVIYLSGYSANEPQPVEGSIFLKKPFRLHELENALKQFGFD